MADFYQNYTHWSAVSTYRGGKQSYNLWCSQLQHFKLITKYVLKMINVVTHNVEYVHQTLEIICMDLYVYIYLIKCVLFWFLCCANNWSELLISLIRLQRSSGGDKDWGAINSFTVCFHGNHKKIWLPIGRADSGGLYVTVKCTQIPIDITA